MIIQSIKFIWDKGKYIQRVRQAVFRRHWSQNTEEYKNNNRGNNVCGIINRDRR